VANDEHIAQLSNGAAAWNAWRVDNLSIRPDLTGAILRYADLSGADFSGADLRGADLWAANLSKADLSKSNLDGAQLWRANLTGASFREASLWGVEAMLAYFYEADLTRADFMKAKLTGANFSGARLTEANFSEAVIANAILVRADLSNAKLWGANLWGADLSNANLCKADLKLTILVEANLTEANLTGARIHGVSAWDVKLDGTNQQNLVITKKGEPEITVDNIEIAQFVYLLLHNDKIRDVIDTVGKKGVLLLGRFTEGRIQLLEILRDKLRSLGFVPIVFNFDKPETKDFTETVRLLAGLSHFVIVDITNPRSTPLELQATVPDLMVPFVPIIESGQEPFAMFADLQRYDWVIKPVIAYPSLGRLIEVFEEEIVRPAEAKFNKLLARRNEQLRVQIKQV
jgi:uncharacterized protein YjbI with pentapeptide repeats